jgi:hypothetical protein
VIFLGDFSFVRIFLKNYRVTMTTTLDQVRTAPGNPGKPWIFILVLENPGILNLSLENPGKLRN